MNPAAFGGSHRFLDISLPYSIAAQRDVRPDIPAKEKHVLWHHPELTAQACRIPLSHVHPIEQHRALGDVVKALE